MATLINNSTGNFTTAATWSLVDSTSFLNSETNTTNTTTSFVSSAAFTPGAITIDAISVKVSTRSASPTGTLSVRLFNNTLAAAVTGTTVTINVSDIPAVNAIMNAGWIQMKFSSSVLLLAANSYSVQVSSSTVNQVTLYRNATAANFSRILRTTTTQAPAAGDSLFIAGDFVSAGSTNSYTVTNDNTATTQFADMEIATKGTLASGVAASTNYYLKLAGDMSVYTNGTYQQGSSGTPVPSTSTSKLEFVCSSNVQFGMVTRGGATVKSGGTVITNSAFLNADAAAAATSLTTDVSTGWKSGDQIVIASTTRTAGETELRSLTVDASGTTLTVAALTNAHSGSGATKAEIINLTRNVQIFSSSATNNTYINTVVATNVDFQSTEFYNMGSSSTGKRGVDLQSNGIGTATINNCSSHDFTVGVSFGINITGAASDNFTVSNNVVYNTADSGLNLNATTGTTWTISNLIVMKCGSPSISLTAIGGTLSNLTAVSSSGIGIQFSDSTLVTAPSASTFTAHSNGSVGAVFTAVTSEKTNPMPSFSNFTLWRNSTRGMQVTTTFNIIIDTVTAFGNATSNMLLGSGDIDTLIFKNLTFNAGTTLTCPIGIQLDAEGRFYVDDSTFGSTTTHATGDLVVFVNVPQQCVFRNCTLSSATPISNLTGLVEGSTISFAKFQQTTGNHITYKKYGTIKPDTTIFNGGSPSTRVTPNSATQKVQSGLKKIAVPSGSTATVSVYVRKSVAGDGAAYNGNNPRLILKRDPSIGLATEVVLATATGASSGAFEKISGTTAAITDNGVIQVYVDGDGTAGFFNLDDWNVSS